MKKSNITGKIVSDIKSCLVKYGDKIPFAFLFGSCSEGKQTPLSDIDIAVFFNGMSETEKTRIEHQISLLFDEQVNILRLEDEYVSPLIKLEALNGIPIIINNNDFLNIFILSNIHIAEEMKRILSRLREIV